MSAVLQLNRCNCRNCRYVEKQKSNILRAVRPAGKRISDDMVAIWNDALENYPCEFNARPTFAKPEATLATDHHIANAMPVVYAAVHATFSGPVEPIRLTIVVGDADSD